jgi:hypothetical protein
VADLGIAHLCCRQSDPLFRGVNGGVRKAVPEKIPMRFARLTDGVVVAFLAMAEAVEYDQQYGRYRHDLSVFFKMESRPAF